MEKRLENMLKLAWKMGRDHTAHSIKFACLDTPLGEWMLNEFVPCIEPEHDLEFIQALKILEK